MSHYCCRQSDFLVGHVHIILLAILTHIATASGEASQVSVRRASSMVRREVSDFRAALHVPGLAVPHSQPSAGAESGDHKIHGGSRRSHAPRTIGVLLGSEGRSEYITAARNPFTTEIDPKMGMCRKTPAQECVAFRGGDWCDFLSSLSVDSCDAFCKQNGMVCLSSWVSDASDACTHGKEQPCNYKSASLVCRCVESALVEHFYKSKFEMEARERAYATQEKWEFILTPVGHLLGVLKGPQTSSGNTEIHVFSQESNYMRPIFQTPIGLPRTHEASFSFHLLRGSGDLAAIQSGPSTTSSKTEITILSGISNFGCISATYTTVIPLQIASTRFVFTPKTAATAVDDLLVMTMTSDEAMEIKAASAERQWTQWQFTTSTTLSSEEDSEWSFAFDSTGTFVGIRRGPTTASGMTEVYFFDPSQKFKMRRIRGQATALPITDRSWHFLLDPADDSIMAIQDSFAAKTERAVLNVLKKEAAYSVVSVNRSIGVPVLEELTKWTYLVSGNGDLIGVKRGPETESGKTEVHIASRESKFQTITDRWETALPLTTDNWTFLFTSSEDLMAIHMGGSASGKTEVSILDKKTNYGTFIIEASRTPLGSTTEGWTFLVGRGDVLMAFDTGVEKPTASGKVEIHAFAKKTSYTKRIMVLVTGFEANNGTVSFGLTERMDMLAIRGGPTTDSGMTEMSMFKLDTRYRKAETQTTSLPLTGDSWTFLRSVNDSIVAIEDGSTSHSGAAEVHELDPVDWSRIWESYAPALRAKEEPERFLWGFCLLPSGNILAIKKGPKTLSHKTEVFEFSNASGYTKIVYRGPTMLPITDHSWDFLANSEGHLLAVHRDGMKGVVVKSLRGDVLGGMKDAAAPQVGTVTTSSNDAGDTADASSTGVVMRRFNEVLFETSIKLAPSGVWRFTLVEKDDLLAIRLDSVRRSGRCELTRFTRASQYKTALPSIMTPLPSVDGDSGGYAFVYSRELRALLAVSWSNSQKVGAPPAGSSRGIHDVGRSESEADIFDPASMRSTASIGVSDAIGSGGNLDVGSDASGKQSGNAVKGPAKTKVHVLLASDQFKQVDNVVETPWAGVDVSWSFLLDPRGVMAVRTKPPFDDEELPSGGMECQDECMSLERITWKVRCGWLLCGACEKCSGKSKEIEATSNPEDLSISGRCHPKVCKSEAPWKVLCKNPLCTGCTDCFSTESIGITCIEYATFKGTGTRVEPKPHTVRMVKRGRTWYRDNQQVNILEDGKYRTRMANGSRLSGSVQANGFIHWELGATTFTSVPVVSNCPEVANASFANAAAFIEVGDAAVGDEVAWEDFSAELEGDAADGHSSHHGGEGVRKDVPLGETPDFEHGDEDEDKDDPKIAASLPEASDALVALRERMAAVVKSLRTEEERGHCDHVVVQILGASSGFQHIVARLNTSIPAT
eukprot:TRINITY_DN24162_c0_g1_i1.p1 TRINITY_DN24162_c0_g1~~TRINITY_DN24162_c0_g1_i1.p1  ORF type:complete len:1418 (-),score=171.53 TRINITY_DN24162_c0_g1_i1:204-4457(-)